MTPALMHWEELLRAMLAKVYPICFEDGGGDFEFDEREVSDEVERTLDRMGFEIVRKGER